MSTHAPDALSILRARIEQVDQELVALLARRQELASGIARAKHAAGLPVVDLPREAAVVRRAAEQARAAGIDEETVRHIFWCLIDLARRRQLDEPS